MNTAAKISIIITCYNIEKYIEPCIYSVLNQTYNNLEIICVNDGSIDKTLELLVKFQELDNRIVIVNQLNQGVSFARNKGIELATGTFLMFIDGDDWIENTTVDKILKFAQHDLVCFSFIKEYNAKSVIRDLKLNGFYESNYIQRRVTGLFEDELSDPSHLETLAPVWGKLFKTSIIKNNAISFKNINEIGAWEDGYFVWDYLNFSEKVFVLNEPLYHYRKVETGSITTSYKNDFLNKTLLLFDLLENDIVKNQKSKDFILALNNRICLSTIGLGLNETMSKTSTKEKCLKIALFLKSDRFVDAFSDFDLKYFSFHWKVFFYLAKKRHVFPLFLMLLIIKKIIKK